MCKQVHRSTSSYGPKTQFRKGNADLCDMDPKANTAQIFKNPVAIKITSNATQALSFLLKTYRNVPYFRE